ncbi:MAG: AmmeMemoRadiSam system protein B [Candidatus Methanomethylophilaceae archaeon]|jgi:AmmeMemoRadiSam system protein B|nr:AmmeMemoRadiSam system protein B [Candidatus Methanomethylophilaceae archaeon]NLF34297.1 AmmeMemoRadiSam system protein B [Thermoplasmatales archaeon]
MRYPAVAGRFYPADRVALLRELDFCFGHRLGPGPLKNTGSERSIVAALSPHAGYRASGMCAAHTFSRIREDGLPEAYVIVGPDHHGVPFDAVMCGEEYVTPLGACGIHRGIAERLREMIPDSPAAHSLEHSVEVQVPFIQYIDPDPKIVPVIMRRQDIGSAQRLATALAHACRGTDAVLIASSDLSHYISRERARTLDGMVMDSVSRLDVHGMYTAVMSRGISMCGYGPTAAVMMASSPSRAEILKYMDSWDSLGCDRGSVVGYGSAVMYR